MGCSFSRQSRRDADSNPRVFKVFNVDDQGQELSAGKIEITDADLILHQKSKEPIRWPLRSLRRYGFDAELFSFESGRRCPTGPGIYAFKCRRAEALFNLLQECIQRAGQEEQATRPAVMEVAPGTVGVGGAGSASRPGSLVEIHTPNGSLPAAYGNSAGLAGVAHSPHHYVNGYVAGSSPPTNHPSASGSSSATPCPCPSAHGLASSSSAGGVVPASTRASLTTCTSVSSSAAAAMKMHEYVNTEIAVGAVGPSSARGSHQSLDINAIQLKMHRPSVVSSDGHVINYAELDLPKSVEELNYGSGAAGGGAVSIVELDPSSSQATYINVPADSSGDPDGALLLKRTLASPSSSTSSTVGTTVLNGASSAGAVRKVLMRQASKEDPHNYANLDILSSAAARGTGANATGSDGVRVRKVTYIQVDVRSSKENLYAGSNPPASPISLCPSIPDSPRRTESYAQIDFHKTAALSKVANNEDEGFRKTRHNSNIEELN